MSERTIIDIIREISVLEFVAIVVIVLLVLVPLVLRGRKTDQEE